MTKKTLLLGSTGLLGREIKTAMEQFGGVLAPPREELDVRDSQALKAYLNEHSPKLIINAVGLHGVEACKRDPEAAQALNTDLPSELAAWCGKTEGTQLVHFSCVSVYGDPATSGQAQTKYTEDSHADPQSTYAKTKLAGDHAITAQCPEFLIFRLCALYDARDVKEASEPIKLGAPTPSSYVAITVTRSLDRLQRNVIKAHSGVYHLCCKGHADWPEFRRELARYEEHPSLLGGLKAAANVVSLAPTVDMNRVEDTFCLFIPSWQAQLKSVLQNHSEHGS